LVKNDNLHLLRLCYHGTLLVLLSDKILYGSLTFQLKWTGLSLRISALSTSSRVNLKRAFIRLWRKSFNLHRGILI